MAKYIKSHSNYVINQKHQTTKDGTIYERDITTIGGRDQFAPGQIPIYRSGNFVITTNGEVQKSFKIDSNSSWESNNGNIEDVWTLKTLEDKAIDKTASNDNSIVIKQDIHNLSDFAYWGSCSELFRTSVGDILNRYPGEYYLPYNNVDLYTRTWNYTQTVDSNGSEVVKGTNNHWYYLETGDEYSGPTTSTNIVTGSDLFFSVEEIKNNEPISACVVNDVVVTDTDFIVSGRTVELDGGVIATLPNVTYRFSSQEDVNVGVTGFYNKNIDPHPFELTLYEFRDGTICYRLIDNDGEYVYYNIETYEKYEDPGHHPINTITRSVFMLDNPFNLDMLRSYENEESGNPLKYLRVDKNYEKYYFITENDEKYDFDISVHFLVADMGNIDLFRTSPIAPSQIEVTSESGNSVNTELGVTLSSQFRLFGEWSQYANFCPGDILAVIDLTIHGAQFKTNLTGIEEGVTNLNIPPSEGENPLATVTLSDGFADTAMIHIYAFIGDDNQIVYAVDFDEIEEEGVLGCHIRPKEEYIDDYYESLDTFEYVLINPNTTPIHTAHFNVINEDEYGYTTNNEFITFPTGRGGHNLATDGPAYGLYMNHLMEIGEFYDERFSDNIWRSMTHEAIKNLDWSQTKNDDELKNKGYEDGFGKMEKTIRVMGRYFDAVRVYVDSLKESNTINYGDGSKLPDYFMSDKLEEYGWDVIQIQPYSLTIYSSYDKNPYPYDEPKIADEKRNKVTVNINNQDYDYQLIRKFYVDNSSEKIMPYSPVDENGEDRTSIPSYDCAHNEIDWEDRDVAVNPETGLFAREIKKYSSNKKYTYPEINTEFQKRLVLNSKNICKKKGTIHGIESILAMFGFRSKSFAEKTQDLIYKTPERKIAVLDYDYDIKESVIVIDKPIIDEKDYVSGADYLYDNINTLKDIIYESEDFANGIMTPYEGLPVIYYEDEEKKQRCLYPNFDSSEVYDGNPYYQMNGGWMQKKPFTFDVDNDIVLSTEKQRVFTETSKDVKTVANIEELIDIPYYELSNGDIIRVKDTTGLYVIIDGVVYELTVDDSESVKRYYFSITVDGSIAKVGNTYFENTITVTDPHSITGMKKYILSNDVMNGESIRIYVDVYSQDNQHIAAAYSNVQSITSVSLYDGYVNDESLTDYFVITNIYSANEISEKGWKRLKVTDSEYFLVNNLRNNYKGNNPHKGNMRYDAGEEYFSYFTKLFKYAIEDEHFSERFYDTYGEDADSLAQHFGFSISGSGLNGDCGFTYGDSIKDGNGYVKGTNGTSYNNLYFNKHKILIECDKHPLNVFKASGSEHFYYGDEPELFNGVCRNLPVKEYMGDKSDIDAMGLFGDRVINTKLLNITFYLNADFPESFMYGPEHNDVDHVGPEEVPFTVDGQCMIKYIENTVMPFLTQMLPSSTICQVEYRSRDNENVEYVDLGLPSGTKWATCNLGSSDPTVAGAYFSWGNVIGYNKNPEEVEYVFSEENYSRTTGFRLTNNIPFNEIYDAAYNRFGSAWRIPSKDDFKELSDNCYVESISVVDPGGATRTGNLFTSRINGKTLFILNAGHYSGSTLKQDGYYWTRDIYTSHQGNMAWVYGNVTARPNNAHVRYDGLPIRPVK